MARAGILRGQDGSASGPPSRTAKAMALAEATRLAPVLRRLPAWRGVLALNYHRIGEGQSSRLDRELWSATPQAFDRQVAFLASEFELVGPEELERMAAARRVAPGRRVLITFDDGYRDNFEHALPILRSHGASAAFFLATGFLDRPRLSWWDEVAWMVRGSARDGLDAGEVLAHRLDFEAGERSAAIRAVLEAYKQLPPAGATELLERLGESCGTGRAPDRAAEEVWMTWEHARALRDAGMAVGGHTVDHPVLSRLSRIEQREQVAGCQRRLAEELGQPTRYFSYPVGQRSSFDQNTRACLSEAGVTLAFSYYGGHQRPGPIDRYDFPRATVGWYMSDADVRARATLPQFFARW